LAEGFGPVKPSNRPSFHPKMDHTRKTCFTKARC